MAFEQKAGLFLLCCAFVFIESKALPSNSETSENVKNFRIYPNKRKEGKYVNNFLHFCVAVVKDFLGDFIYASISTFNVYGIIFPNIFKQKYYLPFQSYY